MQLIAELGGYRTEAELTGFGGGLKFGWRCWPNRLENTSAAAWVLGGDGSVRVVFPDPERVLLSFHPETPKLSGFEPLPPAAVLVDGVAVEVHDVDAQDCGMKTLHATRPAGVIVHDAGDFSFDGPGWRIDGHAPGGTRVSVVYQRWAQDGGLAVKVDAVQFPRRVLYPAGNEGQIVLPADGDSELRLSSKSVQVELLDENGQTYSLWIAKDDDSAICVQIARDPN